MKGTFLIIFGVIVCITFISCGDEISTRSGGSNDRDFMATVDLAVDNISNAIGITITGFDNFDGYDTLFFDDVGSPLGIGGSPANPADSSFYQYDYTYTNGWHILDMESDSFYSDEYGTSSVSMNLVDSVQFKNGTTVVQEPTSATDYLDFRLWMDASILAQSEDFVLGFDIDRIHIANTYEIMTSGNVAVDGVVEYQFGMEIGSPQDMLSIDMDYEIEFNSLLLDGANGCPISGNIEASAVMSAQGNGQYESGSFFLRLTFNSASEMGVHFEMDGQVHDETRDVSCYDFSAAPADMFKSLIPQE